MLRFSSLQGRVTVVGEINRAANWNLGCIGEVIIESGRNDGIYHGGGGGLPAGSGRHDGKRNGSGRAGNLEQGSVDEVIGNQIGRLPIIREDQDIGVSGNGANDGGVSDA